MDEDNIPLERRRYPRLPLTRTVTFSVAMRTEIETLKTIPGIEVNRPTYEINATVDLRPSPLDKPLRYDLTATMTPHQPREQEHTGTTRNLGRGGLCVVTPFGLQEHQVVRIGIPVPEFELTTPTLAEVRWRQEDDGSVRAGLKYLL